MSYADTDVRYSLKGLKYRPGSVGASFLLTGDTVFKALANENHNFDYDMKCDRTNGCGYALYAKASAPGWRGRQNSPLSCTEAKGLQALHMAFDDYKLTQRLAGNTIVAQDAETLLAMSEVNAECKVFGLLPDIVCTDKIILPASTLPLSQQYDVEAVCSELNGYYKKHVRNYGEMINVWQKKGFAKADKYADLVVQPVQFIGVKQSFDPVHPFAQQKYDLCVVQPFCVDAIDEIPDYAELCETLQALEAGYIHSAPYQPNARQRWTQHYSSWNGLPDTVRKLSQGFLPN